MTNQAPEAKMTKETCIVCGSKTKTDPWNRYFRHAVCPPCEGKLNAYDHRTRPDCTLCGVVRTDLTTRRMTNRGAANLCSPCLERIDSTTKREYESKWKLAKRLETQFRKLGIWSYPSTHNEKTTISFEVQDTAEFLKLLKRASKEAS